MKSIYLDFRKEILIQLSNSILSEIRILGINSLFEPLTKYHDFKKSRLKNGLLERFLLPYKLSNKDVQIEFALVTENPKRVLHIHKYSYAVATVLGKKEGLKSPINSFYYLESESNQWQEIIENKQLLVPPECKHGFYLEKDGECYFLTIQSPPTEGEDFDDYIEIE